MTTAIEQQDDLWRIVQDLKSLGATSHHWEVSRLNKKTGRWVRVGEVPCMAENTEDMKDILKMSEWGGPGKYKLVLHDADGKRVSNIEPFILVIEEEEEKIEKEKDQDQETERKKITPRKLREKVNEIINDEIETANLLNVRKTVKKLQEEPEPEKDDDDIDLSNYLPRQPQQQQNNDMATLQMQMFQMQNQQFQAILTALTAKSNAPDPTMAQILKNQSDTMAMLLQDRLTQKESKESMADKAVMGLISLISSKGGIETIKEIFAKKENPLEQMVPRLIESTTMSFNSFTERVTTAMLEHALKPPPVDPNDVLTKKLAFFSRLKDLVLPSLKELIMAYANFSNVSKAKSNPDNTKHEQTENVPTTENILRQKIDEAFRILIINKDKTPDEIISIVRKEVPEAIEFFKNTPPEKILSPALKTAIGDEIYKILEEIIVLLRNEK